MVFALSIKKRKDACVLKRTCLSNTQTEKECVTSQAERKVLRVSQGRDTELPTRYNTYYTCMTLHALLLKRRLPQPILFIMGDCWGERDVGAKKGQASRMHIILRSRSLFVQGECKRGHRSRRRPSMPTNFGCSTHLSLSLSLWHRAMVGGDEA